MGVEEEPQIPQETGRPFQRVINRRTVIFWGALLISGGAFGVGAETLGSTTSGEIKPQSTPTSPRIIPTLTRTPEPTFTPIKLPTALPPEPTPTFQIPLKKPG